MNRPGDSNNFSQSGGSGRQIALVGQLLKIASSIHSIDSLFHWLAGAIVSRYNVQVAQLWVTQTQTQTYRTGHLTTGNLSTGHLAIALRTIAHQDPSLPQQVVTNSSVAETAEQLLNRQDGFTLSPVVSLFRQHQAMLLGRYGLHYCSAYTLHRSSLLPPPDNTMSSAEVPTPLAIALLLFVQQPRPYEWQVDIHSILNQAIQISEAQGLLLPPTRRLPAYQLEVPQSSFALTTLIPHRNEDANLLSRSNPLDASPIRDKVARRLYAAVDGHKNVIELCATTRLTLEETYKALQILLSEQRIRLFGPKGEPIDPSQILHDR